MIYQKDRVRYGRTTIPYDIIKTGRVKTSEVIVDADTITVRTPLKKNKHEIQRIVLDKASWILQKQREFRESTSEIKNLHLGKIQLFHIVVRIIH